ncbi:UNVERIFIED_CONTAM: hypothetical protein GTU68_017202 [Idotea baltica]|nr:hypothetical protein [Idotea baltica]
MFQRPNYRRAQWQWHSFVYTPPAPGVLARPRNRGPLAHTEGQSSLRRFGYGARASAVAQDLVRYAAMGRIRTPSRSMLPRHEWQLLTVGTEDNKGRPEVREAADILRNAEESGRRGINFTGFIEANQIPHGKADVIVTDGWTGNVALKSAEGAAKFVGEYLKEAFSHSITTKVSALFAWPSLRRLHRRIDPRRVNGGVFLGLNGLVVKSHGGADATGFAAAVNLAASMARENFVARIADEVEKTIASTQSDQMDSRSSNSTDDNAASQETAESKA